MLTSRFFLVAIAGGLSLGLPTRARAQTCESLPNPIFIAGSSASQPIWQTIGPALYTSGIALVYQNLGSCTGVSDIESYAPSGTPTGITGTALFFADGGALSCTITPAGDAGFEKVNVGASDVFQATCDQVAGITGPVIGNFNGPTQTMLFVQPLDAGGASAISAEEAYYVVGFDGGGGVAPWNDPSENLSDGGYLYMRNKSSGTQGMIGEAIGVPPADFLTVNAGGSSGVLSGVSGQEGTPHAAQTLGILVAGFYDQHRDALQALAFRAYGQAAAWLPDSTSTATDKRNVRDGHYAISGPLQLLYSVGSDGVTPTDPNALTLLNFLNGSTPLPGSGSLIDAEIGASTIPDCAMAVSRTDNGYASAIPNANRTHTCDCYFELKVTGSTTCATCSAAQSCASGVCSAQGYCEAF